MNYKAFQDLLDKKKAAKKAAERKQRIPAPPVKPAKQAEQAEATPETIGENVPSEPENIVPPVEPVMEPATEPAAEPAIEPAETPSGDAEKANSPDEGVVQQDVAAESGDPQVTAEQKPKAKKKNHGKKKKSAETEATEENAV